MRAKNDEIYCLSVLSDVQKLFTTLLIDKWYYNLVISFYY